MYNNCWIIQLKPVHMEDRYNVPKLSCLQQKCITDSVFGMGWPYDTELIGYKEQINPQNGELFCNLNGRIKGKTAAYNCYKDMAPGDLVITRLVDGFYYIAKLTSHAMYLYKRDEELYDCISWGCYVEKWHKITDLQRLPAIIRGKYSSCHQNTVLHVNNDSEQNLKKAIIMLYERYEYPNSDNYKRNRLEMNQQTFPECLDYKELEDLVYLYMLKENRDYILLPSTCKMSSPVFEFWMTKGSKHNIVCQVKNQTYNFPSPDEYKDYRTFDKIYLFCGKWTDNGYFSNYMELVKKARLEHNLTNLHIIQPKDLFATLQIYHYLYDDEYRYVKVLDEK